ncbi:MAG: prepilin-type N-terminal cleavage/methylation domain-containing protein, partial [Comamonas sp.]
MQRPHPSPSRRLQQGLTLIELLVGLTIGLMTITVAIGTLMISRQVSGATGEASQLQQQAAQAFRTIGQQARQAGSLRLNLAYAKDSAQPVDLADPVAFEVLPNLATVGGRDTPTAA